MDAPAALRHSLGMRGTWFTEYGAQPSRLCSEGV